MIETVRITLKGIFRDRLFQGIMALAVLFCFLPYIAMLSMRQVTELSITLSLSLISFIMLLLAVFLGSTSVWRDIERRYSFSVLSLPITRSGYILGRFLGVACFLLLTAFVLGTAACIVIKIASGIYPADRPINWSYIVIAILYDTLKYILLVAVAITISTVSTSMFLPVFGTISAYLSGMVTQQVYDYLHTSASLKSVAPTVRTLANTLYYVLPNLSSFDLKVNAIYALRPSATGLLMTAGYFMLYVTFLMAIAALVFERREMK